MRYIPTNPEFAKPIPISIAEIDRIIAEMDAEEDNSILIKADEEETSESLNTD